MKKWCCSGLVTVALLALFASNLPAYAWFCPMTGRAGNSTFVCAGMTQNCAHTGSKCCHPVGFPQSAVANTLSSSAVFTTISKTPTLVVYEDYSNWNIHQFQILWIIRQKIIPSLRLDASARAAPSFFLCAQHGPPPSSGRSPPVV
jgi:hypothetical protein